MAGGVQELDLDLADVHPISRLDPHEVALVEAGHLAQPRRLRLVHVDLEPALAEQLRHPLDVMAAHPAAAVVGMVVGDQGGDRLEALALHVFQQPVHVPGRVHQDRFARRP